MITTATGLQYEDTVVGDGAGRVGFGHGKAREVPEAISKATASAKKAMIRVALKDYGKANAVKARLLNQGAISGVGNLLADDALWRARIDPRRWTSELSDDELAAIGLTQQYLVVNGVLPSSEAQLDPLAAAILRRESGGWRIPLISVTYLFGLAYLSAFVVYRLA